MIFCGWLPDGGSPEVPHPHYAPSRRWMSSGLGASRNRRSATRRNYLTILYSGADVYFPMKPIKTNAGRLFTFTLRFPYLYPGNLPEENQVGDFSRTPMLNIIRPRDQLPVCSVMSWSKLTSYGHYGSLDTLFDVFIRHYLVGCDTINRNGKYDDTMGRYCTLLLLLLMMRYIYKLIN